MRMSIALVGACLAIAVVVGGVACVGDVQDRSPLSSPDRQVFDAQVWPILVRDCGFSACHGDPSRFFRVLGPGHERLDPEMRLSEPVTDAELQLSYERARSMIDPDDPAMSLLVRKPLAVAAGGAGHEGTDSFGRDVYRRPDDPSYVVLFQWVTAPPPVAVPAEAVTP